MRSPPSAPSSVAVAPTATPPSSRVDGEVVHADGADHRSPAAADQHLGVVGEHAPHAVAVADRDHRELGRAAWRRTCARSRRSPPARTACAPRPRSAARSAASRPKRSRIDAERVEAVDGAAAARHVEPRRARTQQRRAVLAVHEQPGVALAQRRHPLLEARELLVHERAVVGLGGRQMGHRARPARGPAHPRRARRAASRARRRGCRGAPSRCRA